MAKRFTRNIRSIEDIEKQPKYTNEQNDLLSDDKEVYVRNQNKYEKITGGVHQVNDQTPDDSGKVEIDTGVMQVNGKDPDESGNIDVDSGVKTVANVEPDENGNVNLQTKNIEDINLYVKHSELDESLPKFENEELIMSEDFENAFPDKKSTRLQYVLQGNMMQIFGLIRTKKELKGKSTYIVGGIPDKFNLITEGYNYGTMGSRYHFKTLINDQTDSNYPNKVNIRRITDVDNHYIDLPADEDGVFHISLTIGVEVNE